MDNEVSRRALTFSSFSLLMKKDESLILSSSVMRLHSNFFFSSSSVQLVIIQPIVGAVNAWTGAPSISIIQALKRRLFLFRDYRDIPIEDGIRTSLIISSSAERLAAKGRQLEL